MLDIANKVKEQIIKATATYLRYHEDNNANWDDSEKKVAEETIGLLILAGQRLNDITSHYKTDGTTTLPEGFIDLESMTAFIDYFDLVGAELIKQIPVQYHTDNFV